MTTPIRTRQLAAFLKEAAASHHCSERYLPDHDWPDWYAAFVQRRAAGRSVLYAAADADAAILVGG